MKLKKIRILQAYDGRHFWERVWALTDGVLAVHPTPEEHDGRSWVITHVATGSRIGDTWTTKDGLWREVEAWRNAEWRGLKVLTMQACELVILAPRIQADLGKPKDPEWYKEHQRVIARAINC